MKKFAFTLAEVLLTVGILGIVAAMTIPSLQTNIQDRETVAKLKKMYVTLDSAYQNALTKYENRIPESIGIEKAMLEQLDVKKVCDKGSTNCLPINDIDFFRSDNGDLYTAVLNDGTKLALGTNYIHVFFDTKKNNQYSPAVNQFLFTTIDNSVKPMGLDVNWPIQDCLNGRFMHICTAWVIYNENMDYLKCPTNLNWTGNRKCH